MTRATARRRVRHLAPAALMLALVACGATPKGKVRRPSSIWSLISARPQMTGPASERTASIAGAMRRPSRKEPWTCLAWSLPAFLAVYAQWGMWWGGWSFGYRLLIDTVPFLVVFAALAYERHVLRSRVLLVLFWVALAWSFAVQLLGALHAGLAPESSLLCQPGTHCKWARMADAKIQSFRTAMTGELFAILSRHSLLADVIAGEPRLGDAFDEGLADAKEQRLLSDLFRVRASGLHHDRSGKKEENAEMTG